MKKEYSMFTVNRDFWEQGASEVEKRKEKGEKNGEWDVNEKNKVSRKGEKQRIKEKVKMKGEEKKNCK